MKFFKKVLLNLFPKIFVVQFICYALLLIIAVKAIPNNTELHAFYEKWCILIILIVALLGTLLFFPKVIKIVFVEPNRGQRTTRIALLFFIFLSIASSNLIMLNHIAVFHFGKTKHINSYSEIHKYPEYSFFTIKQTDSLDDKLNAYYINDHVSGKQKKTFHIDIYASKLMQSDFETIIIGKKYQTDYEGRLSASYGQQLIDKDFEKAKNNFEHLDITPNDTLVRVFESFSREKYIAAAKLTDQNIRFNTAILEFETYNITHAKRKSLIIYFGFVIVIDIILILILATGKHFKETS